MSTNSLDLMRAAHKIQTTVRFIGVDTSANQRNKSDFCVSKERPVNKQKGQIPSEKALSAQVPIIWLQQQSREQFFPPSSVDPSRFFIVWTIRGAR